MREYIDRNQLKVDKQPMVTATQRRPLVLGSAFCVVAVVLLWLDLSGVLVPARTVLQQTLNPVAGQMLQFMDGTGGLFGGITELANLRSENAELRQRVAELEAELIAREQALVENESLRRQLAVEERQPWRLLGAEVTMRSPDAGRRLMTIARGSNDGLVEGMAVLGQTDDGPVALVGIVEDVSPNAATVLLSTDFGFRVSVRVIHDGTSSLGLVQGRWQRGSRLQLEQVEYTPVLAEDAIVVTAGLTGKLAFSLPLAALPADVPIGTIETVAAGEAGTIAELRPYADPDQVRYVWVILDHAE